MNGAGSDSGPVVLLLRARTGRNMTTYLVLMLLALIVIVI